MPSKHDEWRSSATIQQKHYDQRVRNLRKRSDKAAVVPKDVPRMYFAAYEDMLGCLGNVAGKRILDFGCGEGDWSVYWVLRGASVISFDISPELVSLTSEKLRAVEQATQKRSSVMDTTHLGYLSDSFDIVWGSGVLHHLTDEQISQALAEVKRVLRADGVAIFLEAIANSHLLARVVELVDYGKTDLHRPLTSESLERVGREYFSQVVVREYHLIGRLDHVIKNRRFNAIVGKIDRFLIDRFALAKGWCNAAVATYQK